MLAAAERQGYYDSLEFDLTSRLEYYYNERVLRKLRDIKDELLGAPSTPALPLYDLIKVLEVTQQPQGNSSNET